MKVDGHNDLLSEGQMSFSALCAAVNHRLMLSLGMTKKKLMEVVLKFWVKIFKNGVT